MRDRCLRGQEQTGTLLDGVENCEEVIITPHGKAMAKLILNTTAHDPARRWQPPSASGSSRAVALKRGILDWQEWKAYRDERCS